MFRNTVCGLIVWILLILGLTSCTSRQPIRIGFVGELTGIRGELGVAARDGAQLAVDEINAAGGINGRPIELLIRDDRGDPEIARQVDAALIEQEVMAILGHITSAQTAAVFDQMNEAQVVLFSSSASSAQFSGQADYFFRTASSSDQLGAALGTHLADHHAISRLSCIYDTHNLAFSETLWAAVSDSFTAQGGQVDAVFTFSSGETDLQALMAQVTATDPEALLFIASAVDTALMTQYGRQQGLQADLFSSTWAQTNELIEKGGRAVEGLELLGVYNPQNPYPAFQPFVERFQARYQRQPNFLAAYTYESVQVLARALAETGGQAEGLPEALTQVRNLEGVQGVITMDPYGDVQRDAYIVVIDNGRFEVLETISPATSSR